MTESIFGADAPAGSFNDSTTYDLGMVFRSDLDGEVTGIPVYGPSTAPGSVTVSLYSVDSDITGTLLASKTAGSSLTPGQWNTILFDTPVAITAGVYYCAQWRTDSWYTFTASKFTDQAFTSTHLTAIQHDTEPSPESGGPFNNGRLLVGTGFASSDGNGGWYGVDVSVSFGADVVNGSGFAALATTSTMAGRVRVRAAAVAAMLTTAACTGRARVRATGSAALTTGGVLTVPEVYTPAGYPLITASDIRSLVSGTEA